ncbi:group I truncated hemoglobin [Asticcacaulis solisilvae]|uniref:group I truncated hemoglobin n=1 Tax=Asticcacaulis solisilvae TaxID=1217274 RepID=UPI003FD84F2A
MRFLCIAPVIALAGCLVSATAQAETYPPAAPVIAHDDHLYKAFGGHDGLVHITDDLFVNVMADPRINGFFEPQKIPHIKAMLVLQFCQILGGGCTYTGREMNATHAKIGIHEGDFNALVEDLQKAMDKNHVPFAAQNQLLAALAPQHRAIVYKPSGDDVQ